MSNRKNTLGGINFRLNIALNDYKYEDIEIDAFQNKNHRKK